MQLSKVKESFYSYKKNQLHKHRVDLVVTTSSAEKDLADLVDHMLNIRQQLQKRKIL